MSNLLRIVSWNANGILQHRRELEVFLHQENIDILLVSETHFTERSYLRISDYEVYCTNHPDGTAHGGTAVIIKTRIRHNMYKDNAKDYLQATSIQVYDKFGPLVISAIYSPPKHKITTDQYIKFFRTLGTRFIAGGDYNAKNRLWGSRLVTTRGRALEGAISTLKLQTISSGNPTYWPTDGNKIPDVLDIFVTKGMAQTYHTIEPSIDLSSDHSPEILTISSSEIKKKENIYLTNRKTNWEEYSNWLYHNTTAKVRLKCPEDIDDAVEYLIQHIQQAAVYATPEMKVFEKNKYPSEILKMIKEKRQMKMTWQRTHHPDDKRILNRTSRLLSRKLQEFHSEEMKERIEKLSPSKATDYSLWKITKKLKRPTKHVPPLRKTDGSWARTENDKAEEFAKYFANTFQPHPSALLTEEKEIIEFLECPHQMSPPIKFFSTKEVTAGLKLLPNHKAPGHDRITGEMLKKLPKKLIALVTSIFNGIIRIGHYPSQWKLAQLIVIAKPGKQLQDVSSYRPISLLPSLSKVFEKLLLFRIYPLLKENDAIPDHQFGFRNCHSTIEQIHRIVDTINGALENKMYCSALFLDIAQAFDKVWHQGLLYKIKKCLPHPYYNILRSFISDRFFQIKFGDEITPFHPVLSGVPQGSILGPVLYTLYTADLPQSPDVTTATYADDTALLASHENQETATRTLEEHLELINKWCKLWRIRMNETKSKCITFTLRRTRNTRIEINGKLIENVDTVKYLGLHLDKKLTWKKHISIKRKEAELKSRQMIWLIGRKSCLSLGNKILLYKTILKPIWSYGIELWGTASHSNIEIIQRFQSKCLRLLSNAPWFVSNATLHKDLNITTVKEEITLKSHKYQHRLENHINHLAINILDNGTMTRRLKRVHPLDLDHRYK
ncbi:hypothetical protein R5R35_010330 [Gryllus longicercus]|uniref:Reverse transcriptase domain-containing protein n=1 Tax=Gryllus longicercus TaxID=2509291 RepID=A0AAN9WE29_9ORTH